MAVMIIECGSLWDNMKTLLTKHIRDQGKMQTVRSGVVYLNAKQCDFKLVNQELKVYLFICVCMTLKEIFP